MYTIMYIHVYVFLTIIQIKPQTYNADNENNGCCHNWTNLISRTRTMFSEEIKPNAFQGQTMYSCCQGQTKDLSRSNTVFKIRLCHFSVQT